MSSKKPLVLFVALIIAGSLLSLAVNAEGSEATRGSFGGGSGTAGDPYIIEDVWDLQNMSKDLRAHYVLGNDINASGTMKWNSGAGFDPVGNNAKTFTGSLDGNGFKIYGLYINRPDSYYIGLFGVIDKGVLENIGLVDIEIFGRSYVGGLAGSIKGNVLNCFVIGRVSGTLSGTGGMVGDSSGRVSHCYFKGNVSGGLNTGGLVGQGGRVSKCYVFGNVTGGNNVGGLVGDSWNEIMNCYASVNVSGHGSVGGLVGNNRATISRSYAAGDVTGHHYYVGGLVGYNDMGLLEDCYATGNVNGTGSGGLIGLNTHAVRNCYSTGNVTGPSSTGGLTGVNYGTISSSYWDMETSGKWSSDGGTGKTTNEMKAISTFMGALWDLINVWYLIENETYPLFRWDDAIPPIADAGPDQIVDEGTMMKFNGSGSFDNVGIVNFVWTFIDRDPITLFGAGPEYNFSVSGNYLVTLNVTDGAGLWATDSMIVTVRDITAPVAVAGSNLTVDEGTVVYFDGSGSYDNVGIENWTWSFIDGDPIVLYGVDPGYQFDNWGIYVVTLKVTDTAGNWGISSMTVTVNDITPPIAVAGPDQRVAVGSIVILNGSLSTDNGIISRYIWTFTVNGVGVFLEGVGSSFKFDDGGVYVITLKVIDERGNVGEDQVTITVIDTGIVKGAVRDEEGNEVEGALVSITASDGRELTFTTGENGSFLLLIPHGEFEWRISKTGYVPISGTSRVDPMGEVELDLSDAPLVKEKGSSPSIVPYLILVSIIVVLIAGIFYVITRGRSLPGSSTEE